MGQPSQEFVLPGNMQAYTDSPIYARTNGYLKKWYFDIGARVKQGQLLATIDSPEVDQQLAQAKADLATAQANANIRANPGRTLPGPAQKQRRLQTGHRQLHHPGRVHHHPGQVRAGQCAAP